MNERNREIILWRRMREREIEREREREKKRERERETIGRTK